MLYSFHSPAIITITFTILIMTLSYLFQPDWSSRSLVFQGFLSNFSYFSCPVWHCNNQNYFLKGGASPAKQPPTVSQYTPEHAAPSWHYSTLCKNTHLPLNTVIMPSLDISALLLFVFLLNVQLTLSFIFTFKTATFFFTALLPNLSGNYFPKTCCNLITVPFLHILKPERFISNVWSWVWLHVLSSC